ncbi:alginate export family protein [Komagataeibacter oboediens]|uniref:alginate export family protein n=1 Tax=Komagataeibacter oboediens TaxID=65958 RepID=UPI001C2CE17D|nr:alginate export family protein [Komagataeibacter oboediens]MBV1824497.1 alginate export family protein [Komagataeibacter oboediens]
MSDLPVRAVPRPVRSRGQWSFSALALPVSGVLAWGAQDHAARASVPQPGQGTAENIHVHAAPVPPVEYLPQANPVGQPIRMPATVHHPSGHQYDWGVFSRDNGEAAGFGPVGRYGVARWAEDWSTLRNRAKRDDPFDVLKYIPLTRSGSVWISFSGETRARNWFENRPVLGAAHVADSGRFTVRNLYGADLHLGTHVRLYGELINADAGGWRPYGYGSTYRKQLDAQQAFIEVKGHVVGAKAGFMFGRQAFLDMPAYVLYYRMSSSVPLAWNGFRAYAAWSRVRVDAWDFVGTDISPHGMFHDTEDYSTRLYGVETTWAPPDFTFLGQAGYSFLDLFYFGTKAGGGISGVSAPSFAVQQGMATRNNFGGRWHGIAGPVEFSVGGIWQGGAFRATGPDSPSRPINAWSFSSNAGYRLPHDRFHTFVGMQADVFSGGDARRNTVGTYSQPFNPQLTYVDASLTVSESNMVDIGPEVRMTFFRSLSVMARYPLYWRYSTQAPVSRPGALQYAYHYNGSFIGMAPQATLTWQIGPHLSWGQTLSRFMTSTALNHAGGSSGTYYMSNLSFRF